MKKILVSVTTIDEVSWQSMITQVKSLGLKEIALFLTGLRLSDRKDCLKALGDIEGLTVPFVHARSDMTLDEYKYLMAKFKTQKFNLHPLRLYPIDSDLTSIKDKIYIENASEFTQSDIDGFAGACLDTSHLQDYKLKQHPRYEEIKSCVENNPIGVNHLSVIYKEIIHDKYGDHYDSHLMRNLSEYDYLRQFPSRYFGEFLAIELQNPITEQLKVKEYLQGFRNLS